MSIVIFPPFTVHSENVEQVCSEYLFDYRDQSWEEAKKYCETDYDGLVSMQTEEEWVYFKNITHEQNGAPKKDRWFIGLRYFSYEWCWSSDPKACINQTTNDKRNWRWNTGEPNNLQTEHCAEMFQGGEYNNINCTLRSSNIGFICEKKVERM